MTPAAPFVCACVEKYLMCFSFKGSGASRETLRLENSEPTPTCVSHSLVSAWDMCLDHLPKSTRLFFTRPQVYTIAVVSSSTSSMRSRAIAVGSTCDPTDTLDSGEGHLVTIDSLERARRGQRRSFLRQHSPSCPKEQRDCGETTLERPRCLQVDGRWDSAEAP